MNETIIDLGEKVEEYVTRRVFRAYRVEGLSNGHTGIIIEDGGTYTARLLDVAMSAEATFRQHGSMDAALDELRGLS